MSQLESGWYADPSGRHLYRYWDGSRWSNQISDGRAAAIDPIDLDEIAQATPPATGSQATAPQPTTSPDRPPSPGVEITQPIGGSGSTGILGVLVGTFIVVVVLVFIFNNGADDSPSSTDAPAASVTTEGSSEAPPTTAP